MLLSLRSRPLVLFALLLSALLATVPIVWAAGTVGGSTFKVSTGGSEDFSGGLSKSHSTAYTSQNATGTANGEVDRVWSAAISLGAGASVTYDLRALTAPDGGSAYSMAEVVEVTIQNDGTADIHAGNAASNAWTGFVQTTTTLLTVPASGIVTVHTRGGGMATSGSSKDLKLLNSSGAVTVTGKIIVKGRSS